MTCGPFRVGRRGVPALLGLFEQYRMHVTFLFGLVPEGLWQAVRDLVARLVARRLPRHPIGWGRVEGREGYVAMQGERLSASGSRTQGPGD